MPETLERGAIIPDFTLENTEGETVSSRSFYMRRNYVIVLLPETIDRQWETWLQQLNQAIEQIPPRDVICLIIAQPGTLSPVAIKRCSSPRIQTLIDSTGRARERFDHSPSSGRLLITNQYGVIFHTATGDPATPGLDPSDIPNWVELIACRCS